MLTGLVGIGLVLYLLFTAGLDLWRWWTENNSHADLGLNPASPQTYRAGAMERSAFAITRPTLLGDA
jgi:hypothetical protein